MKKTEGLQLFVKYKGLEELSYEVLHELIEVINFYDPEHIVHFLPGQDRVSGNIQ